MELIQVIGKRLHADQVLSIGGEGLCAHLGLSENGKFNSDIAETIWFQIKTGLGARLSIPSVLRVTSSAQREVIR